MKIAYADESGSPAPGGSEMYFVVAVSAMDSPRALITFLKRIRQLLTTKSRWQEPKAAQSRPSVIKRILNLQDVLNQLP